MALTSSAPDQSQATLPAPRLGRLGPLLFLAHLGWMLPFSAAGTFIPALMAEIDPAQKVALYATLAAAGSVASMLATIIFGALSDRTRSRFGRRNPWIASGGVLLGIAATAMSFTSDFGLLVALWVVFQVGLAVVLAPLFAVLPERVSPGNLGKASTIIGLGTLLAQSAGAVVGGAFVTMPREGLRWLPWLIAVAMMVFVLFSREKDNRKAPREPLSVGSLLRSFAPPKDRDFLLALGGRFLLLLSFMMIVLYQLFVLTDYIGLELADAGGVIGTGGLIMAASAGVATIISGPLSDKMGRRKPIVIAASLVFAAAELPLVFTSDLTAFYLFLGVGGFAYGMYIAVDQALLAQVLPDAENQGKDMGILNIANTGPQILAPIVAGVIVSTAGFQLVFIIAVVLAIVAGLALVPIRRVK
ncbi:MFS transporter [Paenarthrobacter nitroguajacolicus]